MNGLNGGAMQGNLIGIPTPAGHQAELNYIYGMVEELSRQLAENKRALEEVVSGVGRVRNRARQHALGNDEVISSAADEIAGQDKNLDTLLSLLTEALERAKYSRDANAALLAQYATLLSTQLKQFHEYKARHVADVSAWHRSYRCQLAEARAENCRLREQIWDMQAHAGHANESLRGLRKAYDDDRARYEARTENRALRQEVRFWKRMACPEIGGLDGEDGEDVEDGEVVDDAGGVWSDDDDLIDFAEKARLRKVAEEQAAALAATRAAVEAQEREDDEDDREGRGGMDGYSMQHAGDGGAGGGRFEDMKRASSNYPSMGGVPMQREVSGGVGIVPPFPPPRPGSAASSTGSTGQ